jgi:hypothetical protein
MGTVGERGSVAIRRQHNIILYSFLFNVPIIRDFFNLNNSPYVVREIFLTNNFQQYSTIIFCSHRCVWFFNQNNDEEFVFLAFHRIFKSISILQQYCRERKCTNCDKYLCVLDCLNLYANPIHDFFMESIQIPYTELARHRTIHH